MDEPTEPRRSSTRLLAGGLAVLLVIVVAAAWLVLRRPGPPAASRSAPPAPAAAAAPVAVATPEPTPPPAPAPTPRSAPKARPAPAPSAAPAAPAFSLKVDSDVPDASVFVDRQYVGKTPLATSDVAPGSHALNVSAEGYESQASTIEVGSGTTEIVVRFKVVRLNESIPVVHKHGIGSCEGRLVADPRGLTYETSNKDHAFRLTFAEVRSFEIDYLQKNLRVTRADGKTYNFTDRNPNADALFVFHKKVEAARAKIASGMAPER